jgi:hypothetical protein
MKSIPLVAILFLVTASGLFADSCGSFRDSRGRSSIDFAPLNGFVDVCSRDFQLCVMLTVGYPPSIQTIGYFVLSEEWQQYQKGKHNGFSRYLIAQRGETMSAEEFAGFKRYVHSQQGDIADHTDLAALFESHGRISLGVTGETEDSISVGTILKLTETAIKRDELIAAINISLQLKNETLSLYVFDTVKSVKDTDRIKDLAKRWLRCIRAQNSK